MNQEVKKVGPGPENRKPSAQAVKRAYDELAAFLLRQYRKKQRTKNN